MMRALVSLSLASLVVGCAAGAPPARSPAPAAPLAVEATPIVITPHDDDGPRKQRFEAGYLALTTERFADAARALDAVAAEAVDDAYSLPAAFDAGIAWESLGELDRALERYRAVLRRNDGSASAKGAALRSVRLLARADRWADLSGAADVLLARSDLGLGDRIEALGAKGLAIVEAGDADAAAKHVARALDLIEENHLGAAGKLPIEIAIVQFSLGEVRRQKSERVVFEPPPADFGGTLERRCQALLDAQSAFLEAMRSMEPHWAAMSGLRIGQLYLQLHKDVLALPPPKTATTLAMKQLFEGAMRLRYRALVERGRAVLEHTVQMGERTGEASPWIGRARDALAEMDRSIEEEKVALARLPYSEADLKKALDDLAGRKVK